MKTKKRVVSPRDGQQKFMADLMEKLPRLRVYALSLTRDRDAADDLTNDVFIKAATHFESFEPGTNLSAWVFRIMRNEFISDLRRKRPVVSIDSAIVETLSHQPHAEEQMQFHTVLLYLACLERNQSDALIAAAYVGLSYDIIAGIFDISIGTVKSRVSRAREELRRLMDEEIIDNVNIGWFKHATDGIPKSDPYYPIAKAYEELYVGLSATDRLDGTIVRDEKTVLTAEGKLWKDLIASGALDQIDEDVPSFIR